MDKIGAAIHCNPRLTHQVRIAEALHQGIPGTAIVHKPGVDADVHICMGPWFAYKRWRYSPCLYIDRAYWGDPDCVSVHWLRDGEKVFNRGRTERRPHPELQPERTGDRLITLCDYGENRKGGDIRRHPAQQPQAETLESVLNRYDVAAGGRTTALVMARILGLRVFTDDPHSPVLGSLDREQWANDLAWHNWTIDEIADGTLWQHFKL